MSVSDPLTPRVLSAAEIAEFELLGLTPGHWDALAPLPLLRPELRVPDRQDFRTLHRLRSTLRSMPTLEQEAERFWVRLGRGLPGSELEAASALLGWHLATDCSRSMRDDYLNCLASRVEHFGRDPVGAFSLAVVLTVRRWIKAYQPLSAYTRFPPPRCLELADQDELAAIHAPEQLQLVACELATLGFQDRAAVMLGLRESIQRMLAGSDRDHVAAVWANLVRAEVDVLLKQTRVPTWGDSEEVRVVSVPVQPITPQPRQPVTVTLAEPFTTVTLDEALGAAARVQLAEVREWLANPVKTGRMLFDDFRSECSQVAIVRDPKAVPGDLWIVGDIHADLLTLANIVAHAERQTAPGGTPPAFVFLGDFIDRGRHDHETLLYLFGLILNNPGRVCIIPGNHDVDLHWRDKAGRFGVTIEPAEYCDRLNALLPSDHPEDHERIELARLLIPFWQARPKAVILPDGTLLAHGGFPHTDTHAQLRAIADLGSKDCVNDFLWARIAEGPRKRPNRGNRGHEFGSGDFAQFCRKSVELGLPPIRRFVRGHDHVPNRWQLLPEYTEFPVLTINAMGRRLDGELGGDLNSPLPVVARYVPHQLPEVIRLPLDPSEVEKAFPREFRHAVASGESIVPIDALPADRTDSGLGGGR